MVGKQDGVEMEPWEVQGRSRNKMRDGRLQVDDIDAVDSVGFVRFARWTTSDDHHLLVLRGRQQNTGRLVAHASAFQTLHVGDLDWVVGEVEDRRIDLEIVIHTAPVEQDASVCHQKQMGIERQAGEAPREVLHLPRVVGWVVNLDGVVVRIVESFCESGRSEGPSIAERDQSWIPAAVRHRLHKGPFFGHRVEDAAVLSSGKRVVVTRAPGGKQAAVGQVCVPATEEVKGTVIGRKQSGGMKKVTGRSGSWVPNHACEDVASAKVRGGKASGTAAGTRVEQHFALR